MARSTAAYTSLILLALFASSGLAIGTAVTSATSTNGTYTRSSPVATSTQHPATPSNLVSGSSTLDPLAQVLSIFALGVLGKFAAGL